MGRIHGTNDAAHVSSETKDVNETNAAITTGGKLDAVTDVVDAAVYVEQADAAGVYGAFSIATDGTWTYTANSAFDELNVEDTLYDTVMVSEVDRTHSRVTVRIHGTNDAAHVSSETKDVNETNAAITTGGKLDAVTDVDNAAEYVEQTDAAGGYGAFSIATDRSGEGRGGEEGRERGVGDNLNNKLTVSGVGVEHS